MFASYFLEKTNLETGKQLEGFEDDVMHAFMNYSWPGNLREFRNVVRRAVLLTASGKITAATLPWEIKNALAGNTGTEVSMGAASTATATIAAPVKERDLKNAAAKAEYDTIMNLLKEVNFNKKRAAEILKIDRKTLYNKIKNYEDARELN